MTEKLSEAEGVLYRQVHPELVDEAGKPSSSVFRPTPNDENKLSVDRSKITTAKDAFELFLSRGRSSSAVYGVTVEEFGSEELGCVADPIDCEEFANPAHALVDYSSFGGAQQRKKAQRIKVVALARGQLHPLSE